MKKNSSEKKKMKFFRLLREKERQQCFQCSERGRLVKILMMRKENKTTAATKKER